MKSVVEAYAGSTYPESPRALIWEGHRFEVQEILDRRREPHGIGFLVCCTQDQALFDLYYDTERDDWQIQPKGFAHRAEIAT